MKRTHQSEPELFPNEPSDQGFVMIRRDVIPQLLTRLSDPARRVLLALCSFADGEGRCFPSRESIAQRAGIQPAHKVSYATAELAKAGYLETVQTGKRKCNTYTIRKVMYLQRVHHQGGDVPLQGTGDVPSKGTSLSNESHITRRRAVDDKTSSTARAGQSEKTRKEPTPVTKCLSHFIELHEHHRGTPYIPNHAQDGAAIKRVLSHITVDELKARMSRYFIRQDSWNKEHGFSIPNLCSSHVINGLASKVSSRSHTRKPSAWQLSEQEIAAREAKT